MDVMWVMSKWSHKFGLDIENEGVKGTGPMEFFSKCGFNIEVKENDERVLDGKPFCTVTFDVCDS